MKEKQVISNFKKVGEIPVWASAEEERGAIVGWLEIPPDKIQV